MPLYSKLGLSLLRNAKILILLFFHFQSRKVETEGAEEEDRTAIHLGEILQATVVTSVERKDTLLVNVLMLRRLATQNVSNVEKSVIFHVSAHKEEAISASIAVVRVIRKGIVPKNER